MKIIIDAYAYSSSNMPCSDCYVGYKYDACRKCNLELPVNCYPILIHIENEHNN